MPDPADGRPDLRIRDADWLIAPGTQAVFAALEGAGYPARAVGGTVRNSLMGQRVTDVDIATTAHPDDVMQIAAAAGFGAVPTGVEHGTVTIIAEGTPFEVTTLRQDIETYGRHAKVAFTRDWAHDASRRDFTMNALYCGRDGTIYDPLGGYADLVARRVRFIGDPHARIREDYLRILRFFRFHARYGSGLPDAEGLAACVSERHGLSRLSAERVHTELVKLLVAPGAVRTVATMLAYGILHAVVPVVPRMTRLAHLAATEQRLGFAPDAMRRLAALGAHVREDGERLGGRLRLSNEERARVVAMAEAAPTFSAHTDVDDAKRALYWLGPQRYYDRLLGNLAQAGTCLDAGDEAALTHARRLAALPENWQPPRFSVSGQDLREIGLTPGPAMGELLRALESEWVASGFALDRDSLLARARERIAASDSARHSAGSGTKERQ